MITVSFLLRTWFVIFRELCRSLKLSHRFEKLGRFEILGGDFDNPEGVQDQDVVVVLGQGDDVPVFGELEAAATGHPD